MVFFAGFPVRRVLFIAVVVGLAGRAVADEESVDFVRDVKPIFQQHCVRCHSSGISKGEFSIETNAEVAESGFVTAGDVEGSYLFGQIVSADGQPPAMPHEGEPLSEAHVATVRRWIESGAVWPDGVKVEEKSKADRTWWSLQPLMAFEEARSIDSFVDAKLDDAGLEINRPADRRTMIRRATYDLIGLPPTPEEVDAFVADDSAGAYERLIDRLLASPQYGERWGRHWLDVVRFGESNGFERNVIINELWPFRDYVIRSINEDKPFDQFIREHLAGDVIGDGDPDVAVGTAFLVAGPYDDVGNQDPVQAAQIRANTLDEMIGATSQAFLGLTVGCARCHNHKFDPITQADYYKMYATFSGVRHGAVPLATSDAKKQRAETVNPLSVEQRRLEKLIKEQDRVVLDRAKSKLEAYEAKWARPAVDRTRTEERFEPVAAKFVRLVCDGQDSNPAAKAGFRIDEFEIWSVADDGIRGNVTDGNEQSADDVARHGQDGRGTTDESVNVALAANGATATGASRKIEDFPGAYGPHLVIDGKTGARFISAGVDLTVELADPTLIDRVMFSSAKGESKPDQRKFAFVSEYRIQVSDDGETWRTVADGTDRKPVSGAHRDYRLARLETTDADRGVRAGLQKQLAEVKAKIAKVPAIPRVWIGSRNRNDAKGPFHVFVGGSPQRPGDEVVAASLSTLDDTAEPYELPPNAVEGERRFALAEWIASDENALVARVLANRVWHYHFGTGLVNTPSDFGYMGGRPSHPKLLDWLAQQLIAGDWKLKSLHKTIMMSDTYRRSSVFDEAASKVDGDSRLLWRFPPRRLSAEEIRDTILFAAGKLDTRMGGPGFRLYQFMQDNVCTYVPLEIHGPETYRRAVYHQNARASVVDLMTDFDQPDCAFSTPRRAETTTPLQALTMMNHQFTLDMAAALAGRVGGGGVDVGESVRRLYDVCYQREPSDDEREVALEFIAQHGLPALCRVMLNSSELIYLW